MISLTFNSSGSTCVKHLRRCNKWEIWGMGECNGRVESSSARKRQCWKHMDAPPRLENVKHIPVWFHYALRYKDEQLNGNRYPDLARHSHSWTARCLWWEKSARTNSINVVSFNWNKIPSDFKILHNCTEIKHHTDQLMGEVGRKMFYDGLGRGQDLIKEAEEKL